MTQHHRHSSGKERSKEFKLLKGSYASKNILHTYLDGRIDTQTARRRLERTDAQGLLWSGELAVQQAHRSSNEDQILENLADARSMFIRTQNIAKLTSNLQMDSLTARAQVQTALLGVHGLVVLEKELPQKPTAEKIFSQTIAIGRSLIQEHQARQNDITKADRNNMLGTSSRFAVLGLLQRTAIHWIGSESWFPVLSHPSEDHRNKHGSTANHGWDISVFSDTQEGPTVKDRVKVRSSNFRFDEFIQQDVSDIARVCIDPDLRVSRNDHYLTNTIIEECHQELISPDMSSVSSRLLDQRSEKLLELLDI